MKDNLYNRPWQTTTRLLSIKRQQKLPIILCAIASALLILGVKFWLIRDNGSITPFWDQWDAEATKLYAPYLLGHLGWADLFAAHNEHRIFFTNLYNLLLLELSGEWDPIFQMLMNAILHVASIVLLLAVFSRFVPRSTYPTVEHSVVGRVGARVVVRPVSSLGCVDVGFNHCAAHVAAVPFRARRLA